MKELEKQYLEAETRYRLVIWKIEQALKEREMDRQIKNELKRGLK